MGTDEDHDEYEADQQALELVHEFGVEALEDLALVAARAGVGECIVRRALTLIRVDRLELALRHTDVLQLVPHRWAEHGVPAAELC